MKKPEKEKISVVGLGYIGLPTAAVFASRGIEVIGIDVSQHVVDTINSGNIHIVEPGLKELVKRAIENGKLSASTAFCPADAFFIAVPTPFVEISHEPDLSYVKRAAIAIAPFLKRGNLIVLESTSPVGTTEQMAQWLAEERPDLTFPQDVGSKSDIRIAYCPERVLPGKVLEELVSNDRLIGGMTEACSEAAEKLYRVFVEGDCIRTNSRTAEMAKLTENSYRDVNIAFANELSIICADLQVDVWELIRLSNHHPRVNILQPGPGVGGHCIAVDPWFIISRSPEAAKLIKIAREVNDGKPEWVIEKVKAALGEFILDNPDVPSSSITVACYGLTFKPDIDDLRESPARLIAHRLAALLPNQVVVVEPNVSALPKEFKDVKHLDFETAAETADIHVLLVDHSEFKLAAPSSGLIVDTKGIWTSEKP